MQQEVPMVTDQYSSVFHNLNGDKVRVGQETARQKLLALSRNMKGVLSLGRGDPDLPTPSHIVEAGCEALRTGKTHYTPWAGLPELRDSVAKKLRAENGIPVTLDNIIVTNGAQEAVYLTLQSLLNPGDEVIVPEPRYTPYDRAIELAGGRVVPVPMEISDRCLLDVSKVEEKLSERTKAIILINPNNPTGSLLPEEAVRSLCKLVVKHDLVLISDELYEHIVYDDKKLFSPASMPEMFDRTITINGFSKTYCMTGFRVGYVAGPRDYIDAILDMRYTLSISAATPNQWAAVAALEGSQQCVHDIREIFRKRRQLVHEVLSEHHIEIPEMDGTFYAFPRIPASSFASSLDFCERLLTDVNVLVFPGTDFGESGEGYVRVSYLLPQDQLMEALKRFALFVNGVR
jgi:aminotransferase